MTKITQTTVTTWKRFLEIVHGHPHYGFVFRGQRQDWALCPSLERISSSYKVNPTNNLKIERQMIRDFRRRYPRTEDRTLILEDTLYCMTVMRHYGAPTRLLDFTYSPFVAAFFALEDVSTSDSPSVIWAMDMNWNYVSTRKVIGDDLVKIRNTDETRNDASFLRIYFSEESKNFAGLENSFWLSERLVSQRGVLLCPGNISVPFMKNIENMLKEGQNECERPIVKYILKFGLDERVRALQSLQNMSISRMNLFPGLDGYAQSLGQHFYHYVELGRRRTGAPDHLLDPS